MDHCLPNLIARLILEGDKDVSLGEMEPMEAYYYAKDELNKKRDPKIESIVIRDPLAALMYAVNILHGKRWPEAEPVIMKDPNIAVLYAETILDGNKWPEAEPYIIKDPMAAFKYAKRIFHGKRWFEAEPSIMKDPHAASKYAEFIVKKRWPEAEPYIKKDSFSWQHYLEFLKSLRLNKKVKDSKLFKHGYEVKFRKEAVPGRVIQSMGDHFVLSIGDLAPEVEGELDRLPTEMFELMDLHKLGKKSELSRFIGWIGGTITEDAMWVQEVQSDLLQRTWQFQDEKTWVKKRKEKIEKNKRLIKELEKELDKLAKMYKYPPLNKAYGLEEKLGEVKYEYKKLTNEINRYERGTIVLHEKFAKYRSKLENLYLKWIEAFYHIAIWYAKKLNKEKLYIITSHNVASMWGVTYDKSSVYYRAYDGIAKKLGAKLVVVNYTEWWELFLEEFVPMEEKII